MLPVCRGYGREHPEGETVQQVFGEERCDPVCTAPSVPQFLDDGKPAERAIGMFMGMVLLGKCEQLWVFGSTISKGMAAEIEKAEKRDMPIRYFTEQCEEVSKA